MIWTPTITAPGGVWEGTVVVTVEMGYAGPLTNVVQVTSEEGASGTYTETTQSLVTPKLEVTKRTKDDYENVYFNRRIVIEDGGDEFDATADEALTPF